MNKEQKKDYAEWKWLKQIFLELDEIKKRLNILEEKMREVEKNLIYQKTEKELRDFLEKFIGN